MAFEMLNESKQSCSHESSSDTAYYLRNKHASIHASLSKFDNKQARAILFRGSQDTNLNPVDTSSTYSRGLVVETDKEKVRKHGSPSRVRRMTLNPNQSSPPLKTYHATEERDVEENSSDSDDPIIGRFLLSTMSLVLMAMPAPSGPVTHPTVGIKQLGSHAEEVREGLSHKQTSHVPISKPKRSDLDTILGLPQTKRCHCI